MRSIASGALTAAASSGVGIASLVYMEFSTVPIALNTSNWDLVWNSVTYKGAYGLGTISEITDSSGEVSGITLDMITGDSASISLALDDADLIQGTALTIRTAIIDLDTYQILDAPIEWVGKMDTMSISEDSGQCVIRVTAESKAVDLLRGTPMLYSDSDQRTLNANDGFFKYVVDQTDKPIVWPQKAYFYQ